MAETPEEKQDDSKVSRWIENDNNIKQNLSSLKDEIKKNKETSKTVLNLNDQNFESDFDKAFSDFDTNVENAAEQGFDTFAKNNREDLQIIIDDNDASTRKTKLDAFNAKFQIYLLTIISGDYTKLKNLALTTFKVEINDLRDEVMKPSSTKDTKENLDENGNPTLKDNENKEEKEPEIDEYIDKKNLNSTKIKSYKYCDFDTDKDGKTTNKELKNEWIVNRYRNANRDEVTSILGIINGTLEWKFKRGNIRGVNRDDFTEILDEMLDPQNASESSLLDIINNAKDEDGKINEDKFYDTFKSEFKKRFVKTDKYKKKWLFVGNDINKLSNIIVTAIQDDKGNALMDSFERLADIGDASKNMDYTAARNNDILLNKIQNKDVFLFLCDFDSDGVVNSTDIVGKDKENKNRRDTATVMWGQLYTNFLKYATTTFENVDENGEEVKIDEEERKKMEDKKEFQDKKIINGPETSKLIKNILELVKIESENKGLQKAITVFLKKETTSADGITLKEFREFMQNGEYTPEWENESVKISGSRDIKDFIISLGSQINEGKDLSRMFIDKAVIQKEVLEQTKTIVDLEQIISEKKDVTDGSPFTTELEKTLTTTIDQTLKGKTFIDVNGLQKEFDKETLDGVRNTCMYNTIKIINFVTDLIYLDLGKTGGKVIADMFTGTKFGLRYSFYNPDGTINQKEAHKALGDFISKRLVPSIGLGVSKDGKVILWGSIHYEKLSDDLWDKFRANAWLGVDILSLFKWKIWFNFDISTGKGRQVNEKNVSKLTTKNPIPVNRIGIEWGLNFSNFQDLWLYVGLSFERDFPAGIEQKARLYDGIMKQVLGYPENVTVYESQNSFTSGMKKTISDLALTNPNIDSNKDFLNDMIEKIGKEMQRTGIFELIKQQTDPKQKKAILQYMYMTFIDAFHENAILQKSYEQLTGKFKLTKFGLKTSLANILTWTWVGAGLGAIIPGWGTVLGAAAGTVVGLVTFSTRKTGYVEDAYGKGKQIYRNIETWAGAENHEDLLKWENLDEFVESLNNQLNSNQKLVDIAIVEGKIVITWVNGINPSKVLNIYYAESSLTKNNFSFEDNKITIWATSIRVSSDIKRNKVETFLMIGETGDVKDKMIKVSNPTDNTSKDVKKIDQIDYYKELPREGEKSIVAAIESNPKLVPYKETILWFFDTEWALLKDNANIPIGLQWTKMTVGTLTFVQTSDGKVSVASYDINTPAKEFKIAYTIQEKINDTKVEKINGIDYMLNQEIASEHLLQADTKLTDIFTPNVEQTLSLFEDARFRTLYKDFMIQALDPAIDGFINEKDYGNAFVTLKNIFEKNVSYQNAKVNSELWKFKTLINWPLTIHDTAFIVDKCKAIFSFNRYLTDWNNDGANVPRTRVWYKTLLWPDNTTPYPLSWYDYKNELKTQLGSTKKLHRTSVENLVGFTSFYRIQNDTKARKYSMTALGGTNVLSNNPNDASWSMVPIRSEDLSKTQEWFAKNLDVNKTNKEIILAKLNKQLESQNITLTIEHISSLFRWSNTTIDIWGKIVKLDVKYYFYLLGECANESIGAQINTIKVYEQLKWKYTETTIDGKTGWIADKKRNISYKTKTYNAEYDITAKQNDLTVSAAFRSLFKKHKGEATAWDSEQSSNPNPYVDPWNGTDTGNWQTWWEKRRKK